MKSTSNVNTATQRQEMATEWQALTQIAAQNKSKQSPSGNQTCPAVRAVDLSALQALQKTIALPLNQSVAKASVSQTPGKHTRVASTPVMSSSSPAKTHATAPATPGSHSRRHRRGESDKTGTTPKFDPNSSVTSDELTTRRRAHSALAKETYPVSPKIISPGAVRKNQMQSISHSSSSATTSRDVDGMESAKSPASPRSLNLAKMRRDITKKLPDLDLSQLAATVKVALSPSASPRKTPKEDEKNDPLSSVSFSERNQNALAISQLCATEEFKRKQPLYQTLLLHGIVSKNLPIDSQLANIEGLQLLIEDAFIRSRYFEVDTVIDLEGAAQSAWAQQVSDHHLKAPLTRDTSDTSSAFKNVSEAEKFKLKNAFKPAFLADSARTTIYNQLLPDGSVKPFDSILSLADYLNEGKTDSERSMWISNFTSQNLATFLIRTIFEHVPPDLPRSPLRLYDGKAIIPRGKSQQEFTFSKAANGDIIVKAKLHLRPSKLSDNEVLRYSQMAEDRRQVNVMESAWLTIETELRFHPEGDWHMSNPVLHAEGWNMPQDF